MISKINEPVSVVLKFDHKLRYVTPVKIAWNSKEYPITKVGLHHHFYEGRTLHHVFSVESGGMFFRLLLNTDNLFWTLQEVSDGLAE